MNNNELTNNQSNNAVYHATSNLNTAIENPSVNINSAMGVNVQGVEDNNLSNNGNSNLNSVNGYSNYQGINSPLDNNLSNNGNSNLNGVDGYSNYQADNQYGNYLNNTNMGYINQGNQFVNGSFSDVGNQNDFQNINQSFNSSDTTNNMVNNSVSYEPVMEKNKKSGTKKIVLSREVKYTIFVVFVLVIFVMMMPYVYDFFKKLQLVITS